MAKTTYLAVPPGLEQFYWKIIQPQDRFIISRVRVKKVFISPTKIGQITARSYLTACKEIWAGFTPEQKQAWKDVDFHPHKHGWRTFVADQCKRIKLGLPGSATPNQYHQDLVGKIIIEEPATEIKLIQPHPYAYWVAKKVAGTKNMWEPVAVNEYLSLPLKIALSFKTNLSSAGPSPSAKFYARVLYLYQGRNLYHDLEINLPLSSAWDREEIQVSSLSTSVVSYSLYIHLKDVQGEMLFDNVLAEHSGQNWARDIYCKKIEQSFTRGFYQVPKHWAPEILPEGAGYKSVYPT